MPAIHLERVFETRLNVKPAPVGASVPKPIKHKNIMKSPHTNVTKARLAAPWLPSVAISGLIVLVLLAARPALAFTSSDATSAWNSFNNAFYVGNGDNAYYLNIHGGGKETFWQQAEEIEMAVIAPSAAAARVTKPLLPRCATGSQPTLAPTGPVPRHSTTTSCGPVWPIAGPTT